jgi:hypothetical protein
VPVKLVKNRGDSNLQQEITARCIPTIEDLLLAAMLVGKFE